MGIGNVLIDMSVRTSRQGIAQLAGALCEQETAEPVIVAGMSKLRAAMPLETIFPDSRNNLVCADPEDICAYDRNTHTNSILRKQVNGVVEDCRCRAWTWTWRRAPHDQPNHSRFS